MQVFIFLLISSLTLGNTICEPETVKESVSPSSSSSDSNPPSRVKRRGSDGEWLLGHFTTDKRHDVIGSGYNIPDINQDGFVTLEEDEEEKEYQPPNVLYPSYTFPESSLKEEVLTPPMDLYVEPLRNRRSTPPDNLVNPEIPINYGSDAIGVPEITEELEDLNVDNNMLYPVNDFVTEQSSDDDDGDGDGEGGFIVSGQHNADVVNKVKRSLAMLRLGKRQLRMLRLGKRADGNEEKIKKSLAMLRLGKRSLNMLRLGKRSLNMLRLGKRQLRMLRLGKRAGSADEDKQPFWRGVEVLDNAYPNAVVGDKRNLNMLRLGKREFEEKRNLKMLRLGKRVPEEKRNLNMLRLGKRVPEEKRNLNMLRLGKREFEDEKRNLKMLRLGKREFEDEKRNLNMLRLGKREFEDEKRNLNMLRLGKRGIESEKRNLNMLRLGKRQLRMLRLGKRNLNMLRLGKRQEENDKEKRNLKMLRLGKRSTESSSKVSTKE